MSKIDRMLASRM